MLITQNQTLTKNIFVNIEKIIELSQIKGFLIIRQPQDCK